MESVKTFFAGHSKDAALSNNHQQNSFNQLFASRSMQMGGIGGNGLSNGVNGNANPQISNHHDAKRKDSDSYFYIMWRS